MSIWDPSIGILFSKVNRTWWKRSANESEKNIGGEIEFIKEDGFEIIFKGKKV